MSLAFAHCDSPRQKKGWLKYHDGDMVDIVQRYDQYWMVMSPDGDRGIVKADDFVVVPERLLALSPKKTLPKLPTENPSEDELSLSSTSLSRVSLNNDDNDDDDDDLDATYISTGDEENYEEEVSELVVDFDSTEDIDPSAVFVKLPIPEFTAEAQYGDDENHDNDDLKTNRHTKSSSLVIQDGIDCSLELYSDEDIPILTNRDRFKAKSDTIKALDEIFWNEDELDCEQEHMRQGVYGTWRQKLIERPSILMGPKSSSNRGSFSAYNSTGEEFSFSMDRARRKTDSKLRRRIRNSPIVSDNEPNHRPRTPIRRSRKVSGNGDNIPSGFIKRGITGDEVKEAIGKGRQSGRRRSDKLSPKASDKTDKTEEDLSREANARKLKGWKSTPNRAADTIEKPRKRSSSRGRIYNAFKAFHPEEQQAY